MKFRAFAARATVTGSILFLFGVGCGSAGGGGACGGLKPLPAAPTPLGIPSDQVIEGGLQARITKNGICIPAINKNFGITCFNVDVGACNNSMCGGAKGCAASLVLTSPDGKDKITASLSEGNNPVVHLDATFDVHVPLELDYGGELVCVSASGSCTMDIASQHFNDAS